ncbi:hypothetical protein KY289_005554 [Solanum tuberosum]|nr:hypothetical protein KY289_005554 [Solanum tuberosum]
MFPGLENNWERVNAIVLSWIMNSVSKSLLGGIMYASSAKVVWDDLFERFNKVDGSRTFNLHKEIATLSQGTSSFLMGMNDSYLQVKGHTRETCYKIIGYLKKRGVNSAYNVTGATNHVVADLSLLSHQSISKVDNPKKVHLLNGDKALVTHLGSSILDGTNKVSGELFSGKVNMIGIEDGGLYILANKIDKEDDVLSTRHSELSDKHINDLGVLAKNEV